MTHRRLIVTHGGVRPYETRAVWMTAGHSPRARWEPPVSRQGAKTGMVVNLFRTFDLQRARWTEIHTNDLCPVATMFGLLLTSAALREQVARRLSSMVPCPACLPGLVQDALDGKAQPTPDACLDAMRGKPGCDDCKGSGVADARALWDRIRKAPVAAPASSTDLVVLIAQALYMQSRSFQLKPVTIEGGVWSEHGCSPEKDEYARLPTSNPGGYDSPRWAVAERIDDLPGNWSCGPQSLSWKEDGTNGCQALERAPLAERVDTLAGQWIDHGMKPEIDDYQRAGRDVVPFEDSARWSLEGRGRALPGVWTESGFQSEAPAESPGGIHYPLTRAVLVERLGALPGGWWTTCGFDPPERDKSSAAHWDVPARRAAQVSTCRPTLRVYQMDALEFLRSLVLGPDDVIIIDPDYEGTTGYAFSSRRAEVLEMCRLGHAAGALVILHEAVGLAGALGAGWMERRASPLRARGSSFWKDGEEREWITFNRPVSWWPDEQIRLFPTEVQDGVSVAKGRPRARRTRSPDSDRSAGRAGKRGPLDGRLEPGQPAAGKEPADQKPRHDREASGTLLQGKEPGEHTGADRPGETDRHADVPPTPGDSGQMPAPPTGGPTRDLPAQPRSGGDANRGDLSGLRGQAGDRPHGDDRRGRLIELPATPYRPEWFNRERLIWALDLRGIENTTELLEPHWLPVHLVRLAETRPDGTIRPTWPEQELASLDGDSADVRVDLPATEEEIDRWIDGEALPTWQQAILLAAVLGSPLGFFFEPLEHPRALESRAFMCGGPNGCELVDTHDYSHWTPRPIDAAERTRQREAVLGHVDFGRGLLCQTGCGTEATTQLRTQQGLRLVCMRCAQARPLEPPPKRF